MSSFGGVSAQRGAITKRDSLRWAFFWLTAFYFVYCARPEDWVPGLVYIPMAKITAVLAVLALLMNKSKAIRGLRDIPVEAKYLMAMITLFYASGFLSPVWRGGAVLHTLDFSKMLIAWLLTFLLVTDFSKLRRIIFIQAACVPLISFVSIVKGHSTPRLAGVLGGIYSDPNDLAFAIVLSLPFCLAFFLGTTNILKKFTWLGAMLIMGATLLLTASRAGFIDLVISGAVSLWRFGVKGRRFTLIFGTFLVGSVLLVAAGGTLAQRFEGLFGSTDSRLQDSAYESYEERKLLMIDSLQGIAHYPILGVGMRNFGPYTRLWKDVHVSYLQVCVEGGIPVLILYLLFFYRGFANLSFVRSRKPDTETTLFIDALYSSLVGFVVGACFAPEAYQYFPYFAVAYTSVLVANSHEFTNEPVLQRKKLFHFAEAYAKQC